MLTKAVVDIDDEDEDSGGLTPGIVLFLAFCVVATLILVMWRMQANVQDSVQAPTTEPSAVSAAEALPEDEVAADDGDEKIANIADDLKVAAADEDFAEPRDVQRVRPSGGG